MSYWEGREDREISWDNLEKPPFLLPLRALKPTNFDPTLDYVQHNVDRDRILDNDDYYYYRTLDQLWTDEQLEFEVEQLNRTVVPQHLFWYRVIVTAQINCIYNLPHNQKTLELRAMMTLLLEERKAICFLIKEYYRFLTYHKEPRRTEEEKRIGCRFGDLVHGKSPGHELHNWPSYVAATHVCADGDFVYVRKGLQHPGTSDVYPNPYYCFSTVGSIHYYDIVEYPADEITRLPPFPAEHTHYEADPVYDDDDIPIPLGNFRNYFPTVIDKPFRKSVTKPLDTR